MNQRPAYVARINAVIDHIGYGACIEVDASFRAEGEVGIQLIPGGLYACTPFRDTPDKIHAAWLRLFSDWLPDSAYQADDRPSLEAYGCTIEGDEETGAFACRLCLPVRAAAWREARGARRFRPRAPGSARAANARWPNSNTLRGAPG